MNQEGRHGLRGGRWEPLIGRIIDGAIDGVGNVLGVAIVVLRDRTLGPLTLALGALGTGIIVGRRVGRRGHK